MTVSWLSLLGQPWENTFSGTLLLFHDPVDVGNLISGSSAFSKISLNITKFTVHILLKPGLENFEHYFASVWDECNCAVVWAFFGIGFLWNWNENWPFPVLWPLLSFPNFLAFDVQAGFRKGRGTRDQIANIRWILEKAREFQKKTSISALLTMPKPLTVWITINCGKFWKRWEYQTTWPASWEICMHVWSNS